MSRNVKNRRARKTEELTPEQENVNVLPKSLQ